MANRQLPDFDKIRPAINKEAPWSDRAKKLTPLRDRKTAVVYVVGGDNDEIKVGCTTALRQRLTSLKAERGEELKILFWAEFQKKDAFLVESEAKRLLRSMTGRACGEWFPASAEAFGRIILHAFQSLGVKCFAMAGNPCAVDDGRAEDQDEYYMQPSKRRLAREYWRG